MELEALSNTTFNMISVKIHDARRRIVAICDLDLVGKKFEEGKRQIDVRENFFRESEMNFQDVVELITNEMMDDSTFNIVGEESINAAIEAGLIDEEGVIKIQGIPLALVLI